MKKYIMQILDENYDHLASFRVVPDASPNTCNVTWKELPDWVRHSVEYAEKEREKDDYIRENGFPAMVTLRQAQAYRLLKQRKLPLSAVAEEMGISTTRVRQLVEQCKNNLIYPRHGSPDPASLFINWIFGVKEDFTNPATRIKYGLHK